MATKYKLICSAQNLKNLESLINKFYFSTNYTINDYLQLVNDKINPDRIEI